ncbi:hypothetical protein EON66_08385 [archaeon]|nr:MAG: hypothetical protein EON66_08385 [archaeon]
MVPGFELYPHPHGAHSASPGRLLCHRLKSAPSPPPCDAAAAVGYSAGTRCASAHFSPANTTACVVGSLQAWWPPSRSRRNRCSTCVCVRL